MSSLAVQQLHQRAQLQRAEAVSPSSNRVARTVHGDLCSFSVKTRFSKAEILVPRYSSTRVLA